MVITKKAVEDEVQIKRIGTYIKSVGIEYKDISLYILAFIHRSIVNERPDFAPEHNERLEFLGDAVLELAITNNLFFDYPEKPEGTLTDIRSAIVRGRNLSQVAINLKINEYLYLGKGEEKGGGRSNNYLLANTVEALIGAIYSDLGYEKAKEFIDKNIYPSVKSIVENNQIKDYKTSIQELSQAQYDITPTYNVLQEEGLDHEKKFTVGILFGDKLMGTGMGTSKKKAEEEAAKDAFLKLNNKKGM